MRITDMVRRIRKEGLVKILHDNISQVLLTTQEFTKKDAGILAEKLIELEIVNIKM